MPNTRYCLLIALPEGTVKHYLLSADSVTIGRAEANSIVLDWETVSGGHCELRRKGRQYEIRDLGSTNGTQLNGKPLGREPHQLSGSDILVIGLNVKVRLVVMEEIKNSVPKEALVSGAATQRLFDKSLPPMPSINPVAAAVAKASKGLRGQ